MKILKKIFPGGFNEYHFIIIWTLLNLFQTGTTELTSDEGYYWFYTTRLQWGYYDHPPLIALLVNTGTLLFNNEFGVRLMNVLLMSVGLLFLFKLIPRDRRTKWITYLIILSIPLFNYLTFIVFPDTPLIAFSIIGLYAYKRLLDRNDLSSALWLGVSVALMLYSKYHAVLFVFFILLSNFGLLKNKYFYLSMILAFILFIPHLLWQFQNDFPTIAYHLQGRSDPFKLKYLDDYFSQQILLIGVGVIFVPFIYKTRDPFEKALKYIAVGTFIFFLLSTLKGAVHLHWTSIVLFPIIILSAKYYSRLNKDRLFLGLILPFTFLVVVIRLYLSFQIVPITHITVDYYHGRQLWADDITNIAGDRPVIFESGPDALREAPLYSFYSGKPGIASFSVEVDKSQYELWNYEDSVQCKDVLHIRSEPCDACTELTTRMGKTIQYRKIDHFTSFKNIQIEWYAEEVSYHNDSIQIPLYIINHRSIPLQFEGNHGIYVPFEYISSDGTWLERSLENFGPVEAGDTAVFLFCLSPDELDAGKDEIRFGIRDRKVYPGINSKSKVLPRSKPQE